MADGLAGGAAAAPSTTLSQDSTAATVQEITAPVPGVIMRLETQVGAKVAGGATLLVMEAMKMEMPIKAPSAGTVLAIEVGPNQKIDAGSLLMRLG